MSIRLCVRACSEEVWRGGIIKYSGGEGSIQSTVCRRSMIDGNFTRREERKGGGFDQEMI